MRKYNLKLNYLWVGAAVLIHLNLIGCSNGFKASPEEITNQLKSISDQDKPSESALPYCEVDYVDYIMDAHIMSFEIKDKSNVSFGFNILKSFFKVFGVKMDTKEGQMFMTMDLTDSLRPEAPITSVPGAGVSKESEFSINLDVVQLAFDMGYYYKTPLSSLVEKTINSALKNLDGAMSKIETPWSSRVVYMYPDQGLVIIPTGSVAGIKIGDQFNLTNVDHAWTGEPCKSDLLFERVLTDSPIATAEVVQIQLNAALLKVNHHWSEDFVKLGARVEVAQLVNNGEKSARRLSRSVRLRNFKSEPLSSLTNGNVDLSMFLSEQTKTLLGRHAYYQRK